ncbi:hypothetical protein PR048_022604 [Dryococelus australis]|uniref:Uncharacterized protein n=1 Tax=Dryococelus australis TaxID=614101 RepID=A0ABQ9H1J8_9NEOP|nr:hypothetical protein PR048_022604 [Dryococelus australis]
MPITLARADTLAREATHRCNQGQRRLETGYEVSQWPLGQEDHERACRGPPLPRHWQHSFCRTEKHTGFPVSPTLAFRRCSILTSFTLTDSEDLDVKIHPNLSTQPVGLAADWQTNHHLEETALWPIENLPRRTVTNQTQELRQSLAWPIGGQVRRHQRKCHISRLSAYLFCDVTFIGVSKVESRVAAAILLSSHLGETGSIPGGVAPGFSQAAVVPDDTTGRRVFSENSRFPRPFTFQHCSIFTWLHLHQLSRPRCEKGAAPECKGERNPETPEKTSRLVASSGTILTCGNPGVARPGIELGSPRWEPSRLTAKPQRPLPFLWMCALSDWLREALGTGLVPSWSLRAGEGSLLSGLQTGDYWRARLGLEVQDTALPLYPELLCVRTPKDFEGNPRRWSKARSRTGNFADSFGEQLDPKIRSVLDSRLVAHCLMPKFRPRIGSMGFGDFFLAVQLLGRICSGCSLQTAIQLEKEAKCTRVCSVAYPQMNWRNFRVSNELAKLPGI